MFLQQTLSTERTKHVSRSSTWFWLHIMITRDTPCGEANDLETSVELSEQMRTRIRQVARELQNIGDKLENRYFRPLQDAGQNHERLGLNLIEVARAIFLRYVTELLGRNNWLQTMGRMFSTLWREIRDNSIIGWTAVQYFQLSCDKLTRQF